MRVRCWGVILPWETSLQYRTALAAVITTVTATSLIPWVLPLRLPWVVLKIGCGNLDNYPMTPCGPGENPYTPI